MAKNGKQIRNSETQEETMTSPVLERNAQSSRSPIAYRIVDADAHVNPPPVFWSDYLPAHLRDLAPRIEHGDDVDYVVFEGRKKKLHLMSDQAGRKGEEFKVEGKLSDMRGGGWLPVERLEDMDRDGIDAAVLFGGGPLGTKNVELFIESYRAYNRWLADFCAHDRRRLCGVAYLPLRDVDESVAMLHEARKMGFTAANIPAFPQAWEAMKTSSAPGASDSMSAQAAALSGDPNSERRLSDPEFDRFWAAAVDLDMTLTIHLGARLPRFHDAQKFLPDLVMSKFAMAEPIAILLLDGVFQRFPKLRFVSVESGVGWFAFMANYMDRTWEKQRYWTKSPLTEMPSFYMDQNVYGSFIHDRIGIELRNAPGGRNIMWSSDYPHSETTFPESLKVIERDFAGVPDSERRLIVCERARQLFKVGQ
jgi:predicted TIM-barrel fold metal-dependent hydrolase